MDDDWAVQIFLKVLIDIVNIFLGGLYEVDRCHTVELFSRIFDMEVKGDVVLS